MQLNPRRAQRGITLLESMISIVIVALGILGILGVQLRTLADTQTAVRRAQAIRLTEDLSERIKVNPNALGTDVLANYVVGWGPEASSVPQDCALAAGCTAVNLALYDIARWKRNVRSTMPLGDASVFLVADETDAANRRQLGVMISWRENERVAATDSDTNYRAIFAVPAASAASSAGPVAVGCPTDRICHLQYIQPTARCAAGGNNAQGLCP
ncbi:type IV pilus modification protein PilV [Pseudorhodoferax sp. Leaf267]|uniref:type IV pilus modification protein PilV n=1 Tax=Pseudorhodoferax sp. Leaf267 TaxID=1736316 RepID=UPI0006F9920D|nr:type IV pilus modification protein PilV [Pseudorhodoferax sp. Leaf267]KQP13280.1 hypothetical protein ASF43_19490 [Pseudorhodoferax sp. Leaf267]